MSEPWTVESLRAFEEKVRDLYLAGRIRAPVHLSRGNEEPLLEIFQAIGPMDWVFSTYRSHYHAILKGIPQEDVLAQILAGHSIHLAFPEYRLYSSAIVAGCLPIALGTALGIKRRGGSEKVWCFVGDMAARTGTFDECLHYAVGFDLPIIFWEECNGMSTNTPTQQAWGDKHKHQPGLLERVPLLEWNEGYNSNYCYDREFPHYGVGVLVDFDQVGPAPAQERSDVMG